MAEATTGNDLAGTTQSTGIISRISTSISNVRRMTADPAVQKSIPLMLGVIFGFTTMLAIVNFGLINIFNIYPIIQKILIGTGTIFLIYLAYKISFSKSSEKKNDLKPVNFT